MVSTGTHKRVRVEGTPDSIGSCEKAGYKEVSLVFSSSFDQDETDGTFSLMRPPKSQNKVNVLEEGLQNDRISCEDLVLTPSKYSLSICIAGDVDGEAVLVTKDSTYTLIRSETSNALLVASPPGFGSDPSSTDGVQVIVANCPSVIELKKAHTAAEKLREVLPMYGDSVGGNGRINDECGLSINKLSEFIHMSHVEIRAGLVMLGALKFAANTGEQEEEKWMLVNDGLINRLTDACLDVIMEQVLKKSPSTIILWHLCLDHDFLKLHEQGFDLDKVPLKAVQSILESSDGYDPVLVKHCLLQLSSNSPSNEAEEPVIALCERRKVPEFRAHQIFYRKQAERLPKDEFLSSWEASMPGVGTPDPDVCIERHPSMHQILQGIVIPEVDCSTGTSKVFLRHLPERALPFDPALRLRKLFAIKSKWPWNQLAAYLDPICNPDLSIGDILLKYTRSSTDPDTGGRVYSAGWIA